MRVGLIARMDRTGLGQGQTLRLSKMLTLNCVMVIDSTPFNKNQQYPMWYKNYFTHWITGFPTDEQVRAFLEHVDVVISCETFYNNNFTNIAKEMGVKTILIANYEFFDWHKPEFKLRYALPDKIVVPSLWHFDEMERDYNAIYIPTPLFEDEFSEVAQYNLEREGKRRYLFIGGKQAIHDRNGLQSVLDAMKYCTLDFELVIRCQGMPTELDASKMDKRITLDFTDYETNAELYKDFDAMILPRRYAGQCLPMTEALASALPVVMTDIDPNNKILPFEWLVPALHMGTFMTRTPIEIFSAEPKFLAERLDNLDVSRASKERALAMAGQFIASDYLKDKYKELVEKW